MADEISIESFAAHLPARFLACRELGHIWKPWRAAWDKSARAYERELRCSRCKTVRKQLINEFGHVLTNNYRHADGYLAKNVDTPIRGNRDLFRLESLTRYLNPSD